MDYNAKSYENCNLVFMFYSKKNYTLQYCSQVIYQTQNNMFDHISKHQVEKSCKFNMHWSIIYELQHLEM